MAKRARRTNPCAPSSTTGIASKMRSAQRSTNARGGQSNTTHKPKKRLTALHRAAVARENRSRTGKTLSSGRTAKAVMRCSQSRSASKTQRATKTIPTKRGA